MNDYSKNGIIGLIVFKAFWVDQIIGFLLYKMCFYLYKAFLEIDKNMQNLLVVQVIVIFKNNVC